MHAEREEGSAVQPSTTLFNGVIIMHAALPFPFPLPGGEEAEKLGPAN
jgi:hypothetical protein